MMPRAHSPATKSKCGVSPRITTPSATSPSIAIGLDQLPACERQLETARHLDDLDVIGADAAIGQRAPCAVDQADRSTRDKTARRRARSGALHLAAQPREACRCISTFALHEATVSSNMCPNLARFVAMYFLLWTVVGVLHRDAADDLDAVAFETEDLRRIVGDQPHLFDAEIGENLRTDAVVALIDRQPEREIRLDGIGAVILQLVRAQLVSKADAAPFLTKVEEDAAPFFGDHLHGTVALRRAIAANRVQRVAGEALGVDAHEHVLAVETSPIVSATWVLPSIVVS